MMNKQLGARHGTCQLHTPGKRQRGSVLILSILFLTLITILAMGAARTSSVEALMGHGVRDLQAAFQAGESGLDAGENWLDDQVSQPAPGASPDSLTIGIGVPPGRTFYRVTTRATGGTDAAEVLLQSSYVRRF